MNRVELSVWTTNLFLPESSPGAVPSPSRCPGSVDDLNPSTSSDGPKSRRSSPAVKGHKSRLDGNRTYVGCDG